MATASRKQFDPSLLSAKAIIKLKLTAEMSLLHHNSHDSLNHTLTLQAV